MKRKEAITRELEIIENKLAGLRGIVNTSQPIHNYLKQIKEIEERVDQAKIYLEAEK